MKEKKNNIIIRKWNRKKWKTEGHDGSAWFKDNGNKWSDNAEYKWFVWDLFVTKISQ